MRSPCCVVFPKVNVLSNLTPTLVHIDSFLQFPDFVLPLILIRFCFALPPCEVYGCMDERIYVDLVWVCCLPTKNPSAV